MKKMTKAIATGATLLSLSVATIGTPAMAFADGTGELQSGTSLYQVKNLTQGGSYSNSASVKACNDELQYSVRIHNTGYNTVSNVTVSATLPSAASTTNTSTATVKYTGGISPSVSSPVTVTLPSAQTITVEGPVQLFDGSAKLVKNLDGSIVDGINLGDLAGSTTEFVNFKAKVNCPTPPVTPPTTPPTTPTTPSTPATPAAPTTLPNTGAGDIAAIAGAATAIGAFGYRRFLSRRLSA